MIDLSALPPEDRALFPGDTMRGNTMAEARALQDEADQLPERRYLARRAA